MSGEPDHLMEKLIENDEKKESVTPSTASTILEELWDRSDILKLSICWALTLTTSTLLTLILILCYFVS